MSGLRSASVAAGRRIDSGLMIKRVRAAKLGQQSRQPRARLLQLAGTPA